MKEKRICVIGNMGNPGNENNGQTIKTKTMIKVLEEKYGSHVCIVSDTNRVNNSPFKIILAMISAMIHGDLIVLAVCDYAIKLVAFPVYILAKIQKKKIIYVLIGGWLGNFVKKHKFSKWALMRYDKIFAETKVSGEMLVNQGFTNVLYIDNCKYLYPKKNYHTDPTDLHFCMLSRIVPEKGIEDAIVAIAKANEMKEAETNYCLDIYGEIGNEYKEDFERLLQKYNQCVKYGGVVEFEKCPDVISHYDALLFPTRVMTEGMPGTIIDSMFAGTPVIATKWNACEEIIEQGVNGYYYSGGPEQLLDVLSERELKKVLLGMRRNCLEVSKRFTPEVAFEPLFQIYEELII